MCIQHSARFVVTLPSSCKFCINFGLLSVWVCPPLRESLSVVELSSSVSLHSLSWLQTVPEDLSNIILYVCV
jgi:hypothetical protein